MIILEVLFYYYRSCKGYSIACLVGIGIGPQAQNEQGLWEVYGVGGLDVLENYAKKDESRTDDFAGIPNNTWPVGFPEYKLTKYAESPLIEWCTRNNVAAYSEERKKWVFIGSKLYTAFSLCKRQVNNIINPIWNTLPTMIPSGATKSALFYWVRQKAWPTEAVELATSCSRSFLHFRAV